MGQCGGSFFRSGPGDPSHSERRAPPVTGEEDRSRFRSRRPSRTRRGRESRGCRSVSDTWQLRDGIYRIFKKERTGGKTVREEE